MWLHFALLFCLFRLVNIVHSEIDIQLQTFGFLLPNNSLFFFLSPSLHIHMGFLGWVCLTCLNSAFSQDTASSRGLSSTKTPGCPLWKIPSAPIWQKALRDRSVVREEEAGCEKEQAYHVWHLTFKDRRGEFNSLNKANAPSTKNKKISFDSMNRCTVCNLSSDFRCHTGQQCVGLSNKW